MKPKKLWTKDVGEQIQKSEKQGTEKELKCKEKREHLTVTWQLDVKFGGRESCRRWSHKPDKKETRWKNALKTGLGCALELRRRASLADSQILVSDDG